MINLMLGLSGLLSFIILGIVYFQHHTIRQLQQKLGALKKDTAEIQRDHSSLVMADLTFSKQLREIGTQLVGMDHQIQNLEQIRENDGGYQHALSILEMGGTLDEIVKSCHLSSAEAELLMNLHSYRSALKASRV